MTNPANAIKVLITYSVCVPVAILIGYLLSDPLTYGAMGTVGFLCLLLMSPIFIKWHYPILLMAITCPIYCFILPGNPPLAQVMVLLSFSIAIVERAMNSEQRFISPQVMVWPFIFTLVMACMTARLTGGIGLKTLGGGVDGGVGGGKKYIELFIGVAAFFALTSRGIPKERRNLYLAFYMLGGLPSFISDLYPVLPGGLKYINLLIPPASAAPGTDSLAARLGSFGASAGVVVNYMLARYGLRGVFLGNRLFLVFVFAGSLYVSLMGGFPHCLDHGCGGFWDVVFPGGPSPHPAAARCHPAGRHLHRTIDSIFPGPAIFNPTRLVRLALESGSGGQNGCGWQCQVAV